MTHPIIQSEIKYLIGDDFLTLLEDLEVNSSSPEELLLGKSLQDRVGHF